MPSLYKLAANWEWKESHSIDRSRKYIHQGLRLHKDSKLIYTEAFRLELQFANVKRIEAAGNKFIIILRVILKIVHNICIWYIKESTFLYSLNPAFDCISQFFYSAHAE